MNGDIFTLGAKFPSNSSDANETSLHPTRQHQYKIDAFKFLFGNIAALSFLGNLLLSMAICKRRQLLLKTYNLLVLNLAITDMLTGLYRVRVSVCCCNWIHGLLIISFSFFVLSSTSKSASGFRMMYECSITLIQLYSWVGFQIASILY